MTQPGLSGRVESLIVASLEAMGFEVVRVSLRAGEPPILQIMAERADRQAMTVDGCAKISRAVSALLDVEDPIPVAYTLEVSSPGIDRPLTKPRDFDRFAGLEARVEMSRPVAGRKRFRGRLLGTNGDVVRIRLDDGEAELPFADIYRAKLVLTDELLAAAESQQRRQDT